MTLTPLDPSLTTVNLRLTAVNPGQFRVVGTGPTVLQGAFAQLLDSAGNGPPSLTDSAGASGGRALPPVNVAPVTPREMAEFAQRVRSALAGAGIDTTIPVELSIQSDGALAAADHPEAARIADILNNDTALANQFREISARNTVQAQGRLTESYTHDWFTAAGDQARTAVWARYRAISDEMAKVAGSRTVVGPDGAASLALQFLKERGFA